MVPHVNVHCRGHDYRAGGGKVESSKKVAGDSLSEVRENIGGGGRDYQSVDRLRNCNVFNRRINIGRVLFPRRKHPGNNFFSGESGEGEGTYELLGGARHDHLHADAAILQQTNNLGRLVGCNSAADAKSYLHGFLMIDL